MFGNICVSKQNSVEIGKPLLKYSNLSIFSRWRPSAISDLCGKFWENPQREFNGIYLGAKFGWNRISHFVNKKSLNILRVWPENACSRPILAVLGLKIGENGTV